MTSSEGDIWFKDSFHFRIGYLSEEQVQRLRLLLPKAEAKLMRRAPGTFSASIPVSEINPENLCRFIETEDIPQTGCGFFFSRATESDTGIMRLPEKVASVMRSVPYGVVDFSFTSLPPGAEGEEASEEESE